MSDIGLDLLRLLGSIPPPGRRVKLCKARPEALLGEVGNLGSPPGMPRAIPGRRGNEGIPGIPGSIRPGGKNGLDDSNRELGSD